MWTSIIEAFIDKRQTSKTILDHSMRTSITPTARRCILFYRRQDLRLSIRGWTNSSLSLSEGTGYNGANRARDVNNRKSPA